MKKAIEKQSKYKPVNIDTDLTGMQFIDSDNCVWKISSLIHHVKEQKLEVFDLPLCGINLSTSVWEFGDLKIKNFAKHLKRTMDISLDYPVILDDDGFIMDGWHRVAKALFLGHSTIKAVRFDKTPICDFVKAES
jgi:hypothetical protein